MIQETKLDRAAEKQIAMYCATRWKMLAKKMEFLGKQDYQFYENGELFCLSEIKGRHYFTPFPDYVMDEKKYSGGLKRAKQDNIPFAVIVGWRSGDVYFLDAIGKKEDVLREGPFTLNEVREEGDRNDWCVWLNWKRFQFLGNSTSVARAIEKSAEDRKNRRKR